MTITNVGKWDKNDLPLAKAVESLRKYVRLTRCFAEIKYEEEGNGVENSKFNKRVW